MDTVLGIRVRSLAGGELELSRYRGQVLLIVNVASRCGFTPQYAGLQTLHERFHDTGLRVLAFPCNDFMNQEPGDAGEIEDFCAREFAVKFELFEKIKIRGGDPHPLYRMLQEARLNSTSAGGIKSILFQGFKILVHGIQERRLLDGHQVQWNFHKFLIDKKGIPVAHFSSNVEPLDPCLVARIEEEMAK